MANRLENPWIDLPESAPFVLEDEADFIARFNLRAGEIHRIRLELIPEPYLGSPSAPTILLGLNPGFMEEEIPFHRDDEAFRKRSRACLLHEDQEYPFYLLDPCLERSNGHKWWKRKLREPIELAGTAQVARSVFCIEYFPYHSRKFKRMKQGLGSQAYSWGLIGRAVERGSTIIVMRSMRLWLGSLPELASYPRLFKVRNPQNPAISRNNCPDAWPILEHILSAER